MTEYNQAVEGLLGQKQSITGGPQKQSITKQSITGGPQGGAECKDLLSREWTSAGTAMAKGVYAIQQEVPNLLISHKCKTSLASIDSVAVFVGRNSPI